MRFACGGKKLERLIYFPRIKGMKQNVNYCCCAKVQRQGCCRAESSLAGLEIDSTASSLL